MKHVLCVHLRQWPIDRLRRRRPELRRKAIALFEVAATRQVITHVSAEAAFKLYPGMTLVEAKARQADLLALPATPEDDLHSLTALGRWLMRFSPCVSVYPACSLFLDATGLDRLFGDLRTLRHRVVRALDRLRIAGEVAIAPTPGAAWALAAFGQHRNQVFEGPIVEALSPLPPEALRLDSAILDQLRTVGICSVGALLRIGRDELAIRFGPAILQRIDHAIGAVHESLVFLEHQTPIVATVEFEAAIESLETIHLAIEQLLVRLIEQLASRGLGARQVRAVFRQAYAPPIDKVLQLARPCRNHAVLSKLMFCAIESLALEEGCIGISLAASIAQRLGAEQERLFDDEPQRHAAEFDHLAERLEARLNGCAERAELLASHVPEHAFRFGETLTHSQSVHSLAATGYRPLSLFSRPRPIKVIVRPAECRDGQPVAFTDIAEVRRLAHNRGPERITGQWWNRHWKTRDYFDVLDVEGNRYWLFRVAETGRWFLHGVFD